MSYDRPVISLTTATDLGAEVASALAAASIVFNDKPTYAKKLKKGAETLWPFFRNKNRRKRYSDGQPMIQAFYNSTSMFDELMWAGAWLYYATGNQTYIQFATNPSVPKTAKAFANQPELMVPSWNNKLPGAMLLMTRYRLFLNPGFPYENMLSRYHNATGVTMCAYLKQYNVFNRTSGDYLLSLCVSHENDFTFERFCRRAYTIEHGETKTTGVCGSCFFLSFFVCGLSEFNWSSWMVLWPYLCLDSDS